MEDKMLIEIWSDIVCPFCYIGKRKLEEALAIFPHKSEVQIIWKSFLLSPELRTQPELSIDAYLAEHKGFSIEQAQQLNTQVTKMAAQIGLTYHLDKAVVANSMKAHCLAHFAKQYGKQEDAEEALFRAYFTDGKNIDDINTLLQIGTDIELPTTTLEDVLNNETLTDIVREDIYESKQIGVQGVPFFLFNRKYAIAGAQDIPLFTQTLHKAYEAWKQQHP